MWLSVHRVREKEEGRKNSEWNCCADRAMRRSSTAASAAQTQAPGAAAAVQQSGRIWMIKAIEVFMSKGLQHVLNAIQGTTT